MKLTRMVLALALGSAGVMHGAALATPIAWTGEFALYDPIGGVFDTNDGAAGNSAYVTGVIDLAAGTFTVSSTDTWYGLNWSASGGTLFGPGTYTHSTVDPAPGASGGTYTFTVGAGQLGGVIDFAYGATSGIDTVMVWNVATAGGMTTYTSTDWNGDGVAGAPWLDGFFPGLSANFNMAASVPEASTYAMMLAGLGLVGAAVRRRK
jgi:hypothetical protein